MSATTGGEPSTTSPEVDPDAQCAVVLNSGLPGARCQVRLSCKIHSEPQKAAVPDRSRPFLELLADQPASLQDVPRGRKSKIFLIDLDVHCAVPASDGQLCNRVLTCRFHDSSEKANVQGRSKAISELYRLYRQSAIKGAGIVDPDSQCGVDLGNGTSCTLSLKCSKHTAGQKQKVRRTLPLQELLQIQASQSLSTIQSSSGIAAASTALHATKSGGYGLASAALLSDPNTKVLRRRYRKSGMQFASTELDEYGEASEHLCTEQEEGVNMERVRQILYDPVYTIPERDINRLLGDDRVRRYDDNNSVFVFEKGSCHFIFAENKWGLRNKVDEAKAIAALPFRDNSCVISADTFGPAYMFTSRIAQATLRKLRGLLERIPQPLNSMPASLGRLLLLHAMAQPDVSSEDSTKIPFVVEQAFVDDKPALLLKLVHHDPSTTSAKTHVTSVAVPLHETPKEVSTPTPQAFLSVYGQDFGKPWLGIDMSDEKQRKLHDLATTIVSHLHLAPIDRRQLRWHVASLSKTYGIALLVREEEVLSSGRSGKFGTVPMDEEEIATLNEVTGIISPTARARLIAPWLPDIPTMEGTHSGWLVMQTLKGRYLHTKDLWISWSDAANAADMHVKHGDELLTFNCMCSEDEAKIEMHRCHACGSMIVCESLEHATMAESEVRICHDCLPPTVRDDLSGASAASGNTRPKKKLQASELARVKGMLSNHMLKEHAIVLPDKEAHQLERAAENKAARDKIVSRYRPASGDQPWSWRDAYLTSPTTADGGRLGCSIDAIDPVTRAGNHARIHIDHNIDTTKVYANGLKGSFPPLALWLIHQLDAAMTDGRTELVDELIDRLDNLHLIRSQFGWTKRSRFESTLDESQARDFAEQCRTGVAKLSCCANIARLDSKSAPYLWRVTATKTTSDTARLVSIQGVRQFLNDLENESGRPMVRLGSEDAPYPFRGGPIPSDWSWRSVYGYFSSRFTRLKRHCNRRHPTLINLPILICTVLYLLHHGTAAQPAQLLNLPVCAYTRTISKLSIGKGDHARAMTGGLVAGQPLTLANFKIDHNNLCAEPWPCNDAKGNRDHETDLIRVDLRTNIRRDNPPMWNEQLLALDPAVLRQYIREGAVVYGDFDEENDGGTGADSTGFDPTQASHPVVPGRRNMQNLGETCYMSTVLQTLHSSTEFCSFIKDDTKMLYKEQTGLSDASFVPADERAIDLSDVEKLAYRRQRMATFPPLVNTLRKLFHALDQVGDRLNADATHKILNRIRAIDERWENKSDESGQLLGMLLECVVRASDTSGTDGRDIQKYMSDDQEAENKRGKPLPAIESDAVDYWEAFQGEGYNSDIVPLFFSQLVKEAPCGEPGCHVTGRSFEHTFVVYLDFPRDREDHEEYDLKTLLGLWAFEQLEEGSGHKCERNVQHTQGLHNYRCITQTADSMCFAIRRGHAGEVAIQNQVDLPDRLDLTPFTDTSHLPTESGQNPKTPFGAKSNTFELVAVNHWVRRHFIAYVRDKQEDEDDRWIMFNDLDTHPREKSPWEGADDGEIVHYAIYRRCAADAPADPLRQGQAEQRDRGRGDASNAQGAGRTLPAGFIDSAFGPIPTRETRERPTSSGTDVAADRRAPKTSRLDLTGDVATALGVAAKERELNEKEAALLQVHREQQEEKKNLEAMRKQIEEFHKQQQAIEQRAAYGDRVRNQLQEVVQRRDGYVSDIAAVRDRLSRREMDFHTDVASLEQQAQPIRAQIEQLQQQLAQLDGQRQALGVAYDQDVQALQRQIDGLQDLIFAMYTMPRP
ncbi:hypothetical protein LTR27_003305 [Elasticomyces elasticus]|nr:hypothetical protein LTR27_003305 [Elasticomyces elasticus]